MAPVRFTHKSTYGGRKHFIGRDEVEVLLERIPHELWSRLRAVHFNDRSFGARRLGYVNQGRREISVCALPANVSLSRACVRFGQSPRMFGATRGHQWSELAVRRFMLYDVFLHELGHLQIVDPRAGSIRRKFASETNAQEFADHWRRTFWEKWFDHSDPIHNRPSAEEILHYEINQVGIVPMWPNSEAPVL